MLILAHGRHAAGYALNAETIPEDQAQMAKRQVLVAERQAAPRAAFVHLPYCGQQLIALLIQDPPVPYAKISARLGIPVGSMGLPAAAAWTGCAVTRPSQR